MAKFDADTLRELRDIREVAIRTEKHPATAVIIWVVLPAGDAGSIARASREFLRKYQPSPYAQSIVRDEVLQTTLQLEPS